MSSVGRWLGRSVWIGTALLMLGSAARPAREASEPLHRYTAPIEFDFSGWTLQAAGVKLGQASLGGAGYLLGDRRSDLVRDFLDRLAHAERLQDEINRVFADPAVADPNSATRSLQEEQAGARREIQARQPLVEAVLQEQASVILADSGLLPLPPVSFHLSKLPVALVVSPRATIRQEALIQLDPDLPTDQQASLERQVEAGSAVSALVVPVGGIGTYPTMVQETTALDWAVDVVLHEWIHNYLTLRPLGWAYDSSPETRTMNETAASLLGHAFGRELLERYYPERVPPPPPEPTPGEPEPPPSFDFNAEMHHTRLQVDRLLAAGRIDEAEAYMEARRRFFVDHGYYIRRLNQAYFAFYGAYADAPEGAAGSDPVGEAVRTLWARSPSPAQFLRTMARMRSFADLQEALGTSPTTGR